MSQDMVDTLSSAVRRGNLEKVEHLLHTYGTNNIPFLSESYFMLLDALRHKHTEVAKLLISSNCPLNNGISNPETTPLHEAVKKNETKIVEMLLERGADVDIKDKNGKTPLYHAIEQFTISAQTKPEIKIITKVLKNRGPDTYLENVYVNIRDVAVHPCCIDSFINGLAQACSIQNDILIGGAYMSCVRTLAKRDGYRSLHFSSSATGKEELVILIMRRASSNIVASDKNYWTEFFLGSANKEKEILKSLFEHGASVDTEDATGKTILQLAVESGCSKVVERVLKSQPDVNYKTNRNSLKVAVNRLAGEQFRERIGSVLTYAYETHAEMEYNRMVESLLEYGFTVDPKDAYDREFLASSVATGFTVIVEDLLKYGADVNMLDTAAENKQPEMVKLLISYGADVNAKQHARKAPIFYAIQNIDIVITKMFLAKGAVVKDNADLLNMAIIMGNREIVDILLNHEPDIDINAADNDGVTALHCTASDRRDFIRFMFDGDRPSDTNAKREIAQMLLTRGANVDARSKTGMTALVIAAKKQRSKLLEDLLKFHADVNSVDEHGNTALHIAANNNDLETVKILIKYGVNVDGRNHDGKTALHIACEKANAQIVKVLLNCGADINIGSYQNGDTPAIVAEHGLNRVSRNDDLLGSWDVCPRNSVLAFNEIIDMLKYRFMKMIALNRDLSKENLRWFSGNTAGRKMTVSGAKVKDYLKQCRDESEKLKRETIGNSNVRYHDVLANGVNQVAMYARNESIVQTLESVDYHREFPIYSKMIDEHFKKGQRRLVLLNSSSRILNIACRYKLPEVAVCEVFSYLLNEDLENFIAVFSNENEKEEA